jgi:REP element-mobilizing transposase RayT
MKREFNEDHTPLGYFITFRCYGTWLHGDKRGSVDRHHNRYGAPLIPANQSWLRHNRRVLKEAPVKLSHKQRALVTTAIEQTCEIRKWLLLAVNVRTNHAHVVVNAVCGPSKILNALKANATRELREAGCWQRKDSPWADSGSKRYLWTEEHVQKAIDYVELDQGDVFPSVDDLELF